MSDRYARQVCLPSVGSEGQRTLGQASALVVGLGGLGCLAATYLAAAGVGRIGLLDGDEIALDNLHRQTLYEAADVGKPKVQVAAHRLSTSNPDVCIDPICQNLNFSNAASIVAEYDVALDCTDNFESRYALNDACVQVGRPNIHASVYQFEGLLSVFDARIGPCYRCLHPEPPPGVPNCAEAGVLGAVTGVLGSMQAAEALKLILGIGDPLVGRVLHVDIAAARTETIRLAKNPDCGSCGGGEMPLSDVVSPRELAALMAAGTAPKILDVREDEELAISALPHDYHIPVGELAARWREIDARDDLVVVCRVGQRSAWAAGFLRAQGLQRVRNLESGLNGWSRDVDLSMHRY